MNARSKQTNSTSGFKSHTSHSPEEVWAAGGTTAFGRKTGQSPEKMAEIFKEVPEVEPFSDQEWAETLKSLKDNK